jgi:MoaA/NifB/PqqE/SkfB family radical SAM enzyme
VFCGYQWQTRQHVEFPVTGAHQLIDRAKGAGITFLGLTPVVGEPLVHRKLEEIVRYASSPPQPMRVAITTNGILLTPARYAALVEAGLREIRISMSYPDEVEYRSIYRSPNLRKVVANLEGILDTYAPGKCAFEVGVRSPRGKALDHPLFKRARAAGWKVARNVFFDDWSGTVTEIATAQGLWVRPSRPKRLPCVVLVDSPHVFSDGRVTACGCRDLDGKSELVFGEYTGLDLSSAYRDGAVARLRERFRAGRPPGICVDCKYYNPLHRGEKVSLRLRQLGADLLATAGAGKQRPPLG